jgi:hypothetical protein
VAPHKKTLVTMTHRVLQRSQRIIVSMIANKRSQRLIGWIRNRRFLSQRRNDIGCEIGIGYFSIRPLDDTKTFPCALFLRLHKRLPQIDVPFKHINIDNRVNSSHRNATYRYSAPSSVKLVHKLLCFSFRCNKNESPTTVRSHDASFEQREEHFSLPETHLAPSTLQTNLQRRSCHRHPSTMSLLPS